MPHHHTIIAGVIGAGVTLVAAHQMLDQRRAQAEAEEREAEFQRRTAAHEEQNERARAEGEERERIEEDIFIRGMMHLAEAMHAGLVQEVARLARRLEQSARSALALPLIKLDGGGDSAAEVVIGFCLATKRAPRAPSVRNGRAKARNAILPKASGTRKPGWDGSPLMTNGCSAV